MVSVVVALTRVKILNKIYISNIRTTTQGGIAMKSNEKELLRIIRENANPDQALMTAAVIMIGFLKQLESSEAQAAVYPPVLY